MNLTRISASELKNNTAEVLNMVAFGGYEAVVERYGEELVKIVPVGRPVDRKNYFDLANKYFGIDKEFPEVFKMRRNKKYDN